MPPAAGPAPSGPASPPHGHDLDHPPPMAPPSFQEAYDDDDDEPALEVIHVTDKGLHGAVTPSSRGSGMLGGPSHGHHHGPVEFVDGSDAHDAAPVPAAPTAPASWRRVLRQKRAGWLAYIKTREFWTVLVLGQILSLCITSTNTFTSLLNQEQASIPAFQTLLNYALLNLIYTPYTIYRYGFAKWLHMLKTRGWRYLILGFCDAVGNYFVVLAYQYTSILSAQLINFFAIVTVVVISLIFLGVRYRITQYVGILTCVGGMGILLASDYMNGSDIADAPDQLKGDLFALAGAAVYGLTNVLEEFLVSKAPLYEVIGQLAFWATPTMGTISAIFDRDNYRNAHWSGLVGGYLTGYTLILALFYQLAPIMFRLSSAAFFNISLLTSNFWGVIIGTKVFGQTIHFLYPIAFVLIIIGLAIYFLTEGIMGEAKKPWLGENQEKGVSGIGTARRAAEKRADAAQSAQPAGVVV